MNSEKPVKSVTCNKLVIGVLTVLLLLVVVARLVFGLPREIASVALSLMMLGFFLFGLFDALKSKRPVAVVIILVCIILYVVSAFCLWN